MTFSHRQRGTGFTLIELLLVITILAILSSLALVVIGGAQNDARKAATQSRISQIHAMLQLRFEDYEVRRIPLRLFDYSGGYDNSNMAYYAIDRPAAQELKRRIVVEYINTEMPRDVGDVATIFPTQRLAALLQADINQDKLIYIPDDSRNILIDLQERPPALATRFVGSVYPDPPLPLPYPLEERIRTSSEYLYLILQMTDYEGTPAIDFLGASAFGDTDNDGFFEIVDAFGNPMEFAIEMYDKNGTLMVMVDPFDPSKFVPMDLNSAYIDPDGTYPTVRRGVSLKNLRYRIIARINGGNENGGETISN